MSQLIPLPNFFKKAQKIKKEKMDKPKRDSRKKKSGKATPVTELPPLTPIEQQVPRTFAAIASLATDFTKNVKEEQDTAEKLVILKNGIQDSVKSLISLSFEKAEVNDLITNDPTFQHLQFFDPSAIFTSDLDTLQVAKVLSMLTTMQTTLTNLANKPSPPISNPKTDEKSLARLEKVSFHLIEKISTWNSRNNVHFSW